VGQVDKSRFPDWVSIRGVNKFAWIPIVLCLSALDARAQPVRVDAVEAELVAARTAAVPGQPLALGLVLRHDPQWHTYWRNPGDSGLPTQLMLNLPAGWSAGDIAWPKPHRIFVGPLANYGYDGEILLPLTVSVPPDSGLFAMPPPVSALLSEKVLFVTATAPSLL